MHAGIGIGLELHRAILALDGKFIEATLYKVIDMAMPDSPVPRFKGMETELPMVEVTDNTYGFCMGCPGAAEASWAPTGSGVGPKKFVEPIVLPIFPEIEVFI